MPDTVDPWGGFNQGQQAIRQTLGELYARHRQQDVDAQSSALRNMQIEQGQMQLDQAKAQEQALMQVYGASTPAEAYAAQSRQQQQQAINAADQTHLKDVMGMIEKFKSSGIDNETASKVVQGLADGFNNPTYKKLFGAMNLTQTGGETTIPVTAQDNFVHPITKQKLQPGEWKLTFGADGQVTKADFVKPIPAIEKPLPTNPFTTFYKGEKEKNPNITDSEISAKWEAQQAKLLQARVPVYQAAPAGLPPGYVFNRRTGGYQWKGEGPAPGMDLGTEAATYQADKKALATLTQREQLIDSFTNRIDANTKLFMRMRQKYGPNYNRLANIPINKLQGVMGSGDLQALNLILRSTSNEIAKVESGSIGVAEVSQGQAEAMAKIHDINMSMNDMEKVLSTGVELGRTSRKAITQQRNELRDRLKSPGRAARTEPDIPANIQGRVVKGLKDGQGFTFTFKGVTYSGKKKSGKLIFD